MPGAPPHLLFNPFSFEISTSFLNLDLERTVQICCEGSAVTLQKAFDVTISVFQMTNCVMRRNLLQVGFLNPHLCSPAN